MKYILFFLSLFYLSLAHALDQSVDEFLRELPTNPTQVIQKLPPEIQKGQVIERQKNRADIIRRSDSSWRKWVAMTEDDHPEAIVDGMVVQSNIKELDRLGLSSRFLTHLPWSDTYWPTANGLIAARYTEPSFPHNRNWLDNYTSYLSHPAHTISSDHLSPAEKYDLLVGDGTWTMTQFSWRQGKAIHDAIGRVPGWMGLCHGWAAANHMKYPIPYSSLTLMSASGQPIRFYQSDIKALVTMMWAQTEIPTRFIGFRCERVAPRDGTGRILDPHCFDTNPASLHLTLVNQIGLHDRGFVIDATAEAEVWNYPVIGYKSTYFNPQSFQQTDNVNQAIVLKDHFSIDKFIGHRHPRTQFVVGVILELTHLNETSPSHGIQTKPSTLTKRYIYDLELDSGFNIIGGEWYSRVHPDFIWAFAPDSRPIAPQDADLNMSDWDVRKPIPPDWQKAALRASSIGMPLYSIVHKIIQSTPNSPQP